MPLLHSEYCKFKVKKKKKKEETPANILYAKSISCDC